MIIDLGIKDGRTFKAEVLYTQIMYKHKRLEILFRIFRADENGEEVQNEFTKSWEKAFIANNETFVNSATGEYVDMFEAGIVDPAKVERVAMQNAVSVASLLLTTEATVTDIKEDRPSMPDMSGMGGMGGMPGMM